MPANEKLVLLTMVLCQSVQNAHQFQSPVDSRSNLPALRPVHFVGRAAPSLTMLAGKKGKNEKKVASPKPVGPKGFATADAVGISQRSAPKIHLLTNSLQGADLCEFL